MTTKPPPKEREKQKQTKKFNFISVNEYFHATWQGYVSLLVITAFIVASIVYQKSSTLTDDELDQIDAGDTAWMMVASCLVLLMTPGLAFFYGGMVQSKNLISTLLQSYSAIMIFGILWIFIEFSLSFGEDLGNAGILGNPGTYFLFKNVGNSPIPNPYSEDATIPFTVYALFQLRFAIITPAIISGSFGERVNYKSFLLFMILFSIFIYCPICHMQWGPGGMLAKWAVHDYAGGTVVHITSGCSALAGAWYIAPSAIHRKKVKVQPANVPLVMLGTALLLFGWFGFNGGSSFKADTVAAQSILNTQASAATGMMAWLYMDFFRQRKLSATGVCLGCIVGLVGITPGAGYVSTGAALLIGLLTSIAANISCFFIKNTADIDDTLDVFSCHGVGGVVGVLLTALFADSKINPDILKNKGSNGLFVENGNADLFWKSLVVVIALMPTIMFITLILLKVTDYFLPLRVNEDVETNGLDASVHGEVIFHQLESLDQQGNGRDNKPRNIDLEMGVRNKGHPLSLNNHSISPVVPISSAQI